MKTEIKKDNEFIRLTYLEKILFFSVIVLGILIITLSTKLIQTQFGKASLTLGIVMLGIISIFKVIKLWGPKD